LGLVLGGMIWALFAIALNVLFAIAAAALWTNYFDSRKAKRRKREVGYLRDEIQIDPGVMPQFKPTWPNAR